MGTSETVMDEKVRNDGAKGASPPSLEGNRCKEPSVAITTETARFLRWKAWKYMLLNDRGWEVTRNMLRRPFRYGWNFFRSLFRKEPFRQKGGFFFYSVASMEEFFRLLRDENTVCIVGFSYCQKPYECPATRFSDGCIADPDNDICRQCFIGKVFNALPATAGVVPVVITTVHHIGDVVFQTIEQHPRKQVIFLIAACEMTLRMFADWGNMAGIRGIGVRLSGGYCNTMRAFVASERGVKPGLTTIDTDMQEKILQLAQ